MSFSTLISVIKGCPSGEGYRDALCTRVFWIQEEQFGSGDPSLKVPTTTEMPDTDWTCLLKPIAAPYTTGATENFMKPQTFCVPRKQ